MQFIIHLCSIILILSNSFTLSIEYIYNNTLYIVYYVHCTLYFLVLFNDLLYMVIQCTMSSSQGAKPVTVLTANVRDVGPNQYKALVSL